LLGIFGIITAKLGSFAAARFAGQYVRIAGQFGRLPARQGLDDGPDNGKRDNRGNGY
jgi:hypothetical protein